MSKNLNVITTENVKKKIKYAIIGNVLYVQKNANKILIVTMAFSVRITCALIVGLVINAPLALPVAKWDAKRTNANKLKIAKKTARFAKTINVDVVAALSGIVNFMNFVVTVYVNTKNVRDIAHAAGCKRILYVIKITLQIYASSHAHGDRLVYNVLQMWIARSILKKYV